MGTAMDVAKEFLSADEMDFREVGDGLVVPLSDPAGRWSATLVEINRCFICTSAFPVNCPEEQRPAMAELLARLNWPLLIGSWEMDWSDGEVRYRTSAPLRHGDLTVELARDLCYTNFSTFANGWRPLMTVLTGAATPAEALDAARNKVDRERKAFGALMEKMGFAPGEDPFNPPPPDADGEAKPDEPAGGT